jgi:preprotein translocase subunit SecA
MGSVDARQKSRGWAAYQDRLAAVNALATEFRDASDEKLVRLAQHLRAQASSGVPLNDVAIQVSALVREVASRTLGLRPFDVQVVGGLALHEGKIVQMQTGEGKTLAAVAPVVLNALPCQGVHVLTFNDYLARRDAEWMGPIYRFLGLSVRFVQAGMSPQARREAYQADVTYVTAKEAGFDYLRDGLVMDPGAMVHRSFHMALVDEADSILIDEARIPLVIAGNLEGQSEEPERLAALVRQLAHDEHYVLDRERGMDRVEGMLNCGNLYSPENLHLLAGVNAALYAATLMQLDVDYIVRHGRVEMVDEFTGRVVEDRHWPDGLQAAIEAKEQVRRTGEATVLGQITLQHFLLQYPRHESRRVDDQLRGRAGRQGDPGSSRFFISLEDDLLQQTGVNELISAGRLAPAPQWEPVGNPALGRQIVHAQKVMEGRNGDIRRGLWYYSNLIEQQRRMVYQRRRRILTGDERWQVLGERVPAAYERAVGLIGGATTADLERRLALYAIDQCWADHLATIAEVKEGIHLARVGGLSPLNEFHKSVVQSFELFFDSMADRVVDKFMALCITADGVDLDAAGLRGPCSTWTYLVEEEAYHDPLAAILISQSHIGFAAGAASTGPLLLLWALVRRFWRRGS